ncbi:MAG TPA: Spy/CpxP family protein refolding chaperone [Casimicrobiaceae bacterium]|nr:Spy/CpxP family protein refolding chaperone [Casimicrobiaceae bacterium]
MRRVSLVAVALAACVAGAAASAQMPKGREPGPMGGRSGGGGPGEGRMVGANVTELVNIRLSQLEEDLNLTQPQLPVWNTYKTRVLQLLDDTKRGARVSASEATAPKRLDALADMARNRLTAVEDIVDAGKALYAVLTPEQKGIADRRLALPLVTLTGNDTGGDVQLRLPPAPPKQ